MPIRSPGPTATTITGRSASRLNKQHLLAAAVRSAVDAEKGRGATDLPAVQQFADHLESRDPVDAIATARNTPSAWLIHRHSGGYRGFDLAAEESRLFQRDQARQVELECLVEHGFDVRPGVHGDRRHGHALGQAQRPIGAQMVFQPESLDAA